MIECRVQQAERLKSFTDDHCAQASFFFERLLKDKEIKVNGKKVSTDVWLETGDVVQYYLTAKQQSRVAFYPVFEDENVCVVDKESGVNSAAVFAELSRRGEYYFIHRLDRNTRGLLVFAKTRFAESELLSAFHNHCLEKTYHALVFGVPKQSRAVLTAYLKKDENNSLVQIYDTPVKHSEEIITEYKNAQKQADGTWLVEIKLHTGKTHQIRAHLAHINCAIVGDMKYGDTQKNKERNNARQCLVAKRLTFYLDGELAYLQDKTFTSRFEV